jgi:DNA-directed RNA polymerase specialized sigma24 family protein
MMRVPAARPGAVHRPSGEHAPLVNVPADRADDGELREILRARTTAPAPQRPAIGVPRVLHLHLHGVSAAEIAAILARRRGSANMPADEQDP